jgi:tRNA-dihydrouridine synthase
METIKATYMSLKPYFETRNFSVMNKTIAQIAKQNELLDANFQDLVKTIKKSPNIPQKEKVEVISGGYKEIMKFYTEQNQAFTEITKELGYLPKEMQKAQKVINKLIEKNMNEMSKMITEIR